MTGRHLIAPELDVALAKLGDALAELSPEARAEMWAEMPAGWTAYADQVDAAHDQSVGSRKYTADDYLGWVPRTDVDDWIRIGALDTFLGWIDGRGRTCMHAPDHRRPEPVFSCAWKPNLVVCARCLHLLDVVGDADMTCDRCGRICAGVEADDGVYNGTVWLGALAYEFGVCGDCRPDFKGAVA